MTEEQIIEGNKLIAKFMGYTHDEFEDDDDDDMTITYYCHNHLENISGKEPWETTVDDWTSWLRPDEMKFHSSWNWLMKVVEKIESIRVPQIAYGFDLNMLGKRWVTIVNISTGKEVVVVGLADYNEKIFHTKIEAVWLAVVEFIKWYNGTRTNH